GGPARCAGVVKADAYGLGMARVAPALAAAGCRTFFVAQLEEGLDLRRLLPAAEIAVLAAPVAEAEAEYAANRLLPVLNSLPDLEHWRRFALAHADAPAAILHIDTGMARLGLSPAELDRLAAEPERLAGVRLAAVMSHLACADEPEHPRNPAQLAAFHDALRRLPPPPASLANSSGTFLGAQYHFALARPGVALYGANPVRGRPNPMRPVVRLQGRILQLREVDRP